MLAGGVIAIVFVEVYLTHWGIFSTTQHSLYIVALTVTSTVLATFITNQIRMLLLQQIDSDLAAGHESRRFEMLNKRWQTILGIESLFTKVAHPQIAMVYIVTGLITTALVASFSPSATFRQYPFSSVLPLGPNRCVSGWLPSKPEDVAYWWPPLPGTDKGYFIYAALDDCPTRDSMTLMGNINVNDPSIFAYADKGVAIHSSAVGAPLSIYSPEGAAVDQGLHALVDQYGSSIVNTTKCVPVMVKNPISCHRGGSIVPVGAESAIVFSDDGMCNRTAHFSVANPFYDPKGGVMDNGMCTHGNVGQGTILFGAFSHYAQYLALTMGDLNWAPDWQDNNITYTVTCSLDATDVFDYRTLIFSQESSTIITNSGYAKSLFASESCTPDTATVGLIQIATAAAANWQPLKEGQMLDGLFDSILQVAVSNITALLAREPPWAFNNSANALEDVLGLTAALVVSRINSSTVAIDSTVVVTAMRMGTGSLYALAFSIPPAIASLVLVYLLRFASGSSKGLPVRSSSMISLMKFGKNHDIESSEYSSNLLAARDEWDR